MAASRLAMNLFIFLFRMFLSKSLPHRSRTTKYTNYTKIGWSRGWNAKIIVFHRCSLRGPVPLAGWGEGAMACVYRY